MSPRLSVSAAVAPRRLCVCADDFGLSEGINDGVLALIERGAVTATSAMVLRSAWPAGARRLRDLPPAAADLGLHLDLTDVDGSAREAPLLPLIVQSHTGRLDLRALRAGIREQLDRFEQALGRAPDHVDGHRHVHQLPEVRELLIEALAERYPHEGPWLRNTRPPAGLSGVGAKPRLIHALGGRALARLAHRHGLPMSRALLGVYGFQGGRDAYRLRLAGWLAQCRDGDLLMCHPAAGTTAGDALAEARMAEFAELSLLRPALHLPAGRIDLRPLSQQLRERAPEVPPPHGP